MHPWKVAGEEGKGRAELELEIRVVRSQDPVKVWMSSAVVLACDALPGLSMSLWWKGRLMPDVSILSSGFVWCFMGLCFTGKWHNFIWDRGKSRILHRDSFPHSDRVRLGLDNYWIPTYPCYNIGSDPNHPIFGYRQR